MYFANETVFYIVSLVKYNNRENKASSQKITT